MIAKDQPTIFGEDVIAVTSSVSDGNMRFDRGDDVLTLQNRKAFLKRVGVQLENTTLLAVTYDTKDFARYRTVFSEHKREGILREDPRVPADALVVTKPNHALLLILGDCVGMIVYDEKQHILMLSHVGRHSAEIDGAAKSINYLKQQFATNPADVKVWLSPAVGKATYPLRAKNNKGLHEVILEQLAAVGVLSDNIEASKVDTAKSTEYFSHSQFKTGGRDFDGRFAVVAQMRGQGEPAS